MLAKIGDLPEMNELGAEGREFCAVIDGNGWFKRDRIARELHAQRLVHQGAGDDEGPEIA